MDFLKQHIEALIFVSPQAIALPDIQAVLTEVFGVEVAETDILEVIDGLKQQYSQDQYAFELLEIAGGYQFMTKGAFHNTVAVHLKQTTKKRLTRAALETLAIVAYKQPVSKSDLEAIRGVNCDYALQKLLEKELVEITGRSEGPGRPLLYATSEKFMDYLGIKALTDLPKPKDFKEVENMIGAMPEADEIPTEETDTEQQSD
ncbi:MAG: SMC-Scp complex subunit ScpB [Bacteroidetes bacterium]|nr:MAG: SMC-Scp complex subunit ScpB [Bacteroidota bacterium]